MMKLAVLISALLVAASSAFVPHASRPQQPSLVRVQASFDPLGLSSSDGEERRAAPAAIAAGAAFTASAAALASSPLAALAEDDYEYGAVDAPIAIPVVGGILAILTALLPVFLKGGEEAFEEMKEQDKDNWGR
uniref:Uncharacterized protein n=1 Tax=Odontella aurita TaxID=265563 RepID=A0A7S4M8Q1_9STRA|mmetsp:Transcript_14024/g.41063  ORF Transcript_14024/g.41063 Transcript_14024/m.41063 type:complete len:134 (+) Transcript_14024:101-502(+)